MNLKKYINPSSKNVFTLMSGTMVSQAISVVVSPILTRIYTPDDYGILGVYVAFISISSVIVSLKFDAAILLPKQDSKALKLVKLCSLLVLFISSILLVLVFLFNKPFIEILKTPELNIYIYLGIVSIIFIGFFNIFSATLNRFKSYKGMATAKVGRTSGTSFGQLGFGAFGFGFSGLIFGKLVGDGLGFITSWAFLRKEERFKNSEKDEDPTYKELVIEYQEFPKVTASQSFINTASSSFPVLILSSFFSSSIVGLFNQCLKITFLPITLISASTYQVFSRKITEMHNNGSSIEEVCLNTLKKLSLIGFVPFAFLAVFAPQAFGFVFGAEWSDAGKFAQLMVPYLFLLFIVTPLTYLPILLDVQRKAFVINVVYLVLRIIALLIGVYFKNAFIAIGLYSLVGFLTMSYLLNWYLKLSKIKP